MAWSTAKHVWRAFCWASFPPVPSDTSWGEGVPCKSGYTGRTHVFLARPVTPWGLTPSPVHRRLRCPENVTVCLCKETLIHLSGRKHPKGHGKALSSEHAWFGGGNIVLHFCDSAFLWLTTVPSEWQKCFCGPINVSHKVRVQYYQTNALFFQWIWSFHLTLQTKG